MVAQPDRFHATQELLRAHATDYVWLAAHYDEICGQIQAALREGPTVRPAVATLAAIVQYVISRDDLARWRSPLYDALLLAMDMGDDAFQIEIWSLLGSVLLRSGNYKSATDALGKALANSQSPASEEVVLLACIGMLSLHGMYHFNDIDSFISDTLGQARRSDRPELHARLYANLGLAYLHRARTVESMAYTQVAYALWRGLDNQQEQRRALLVMAEACRLAGRFEQSLRYLHLVGEDGTDSYTTGLQRYHEGAVFLAQAQYEAAEKALQQALERFDQLDYPYLSASAHHALGITQTYCGSYASAEQHLNDALQEWERSGNRFQRASVIHALGYLAQMQGHHETARTRYLDALRFLDDFPESPVVLTVRQSVQEDLASLPP